MKNFSELTREERIEKVMSLRRQDFCLILENLSEELNISAILRTAEAFGVGKIYIIHPEDKLPHLSKNTSSGATKWLTIEYFTDISMCIKQVKNDGFLVIGALVDPKAKIVWEGRFTEKVAIVVGNEAQGMSSVAQELVAENYYLPMYGLTESLNVSAAAGIFLYEVIRQKEKV